MGFFAAAPILFLCNACAPAADVDTSDENPEELPDIAGEYACVLTEISGCDAEWGAWATEQPS